MKKEELKKYILENEDLLIIASEINSYDCSLEDLNYQENIDEFFEINFNNNIIEAVRAVCYGNYNYTDEYVKFNAYGNLESCTEYELKSILENNIDEILDRLLELYLNFNWLDSELIKKIEEYKETEEQKRRKNK